MRRIAGRPTAGRVRPEGIRLGCCSWRRQCEGEGHERDGRECHGNLHPALAAPLSKQSSDAAEKSGSCGSKALAGPGTSVLGLLMGQPNRASGLADALAANPSGHDHSLIPWTMSRHGWRETEPIDIGPVEQPTLLSRALDSMHSELAITTDDLGREMRLPIDVLRSLLADVMPDADSKPIVRFDCPIGPSGSWPGTCALVRSDAVLLRLVGVSDYVSGALLLLLS